MKASIKKTKKKKKLQRVWNRADLCASRRRLKSLELNWAWRVITVPGLQVSHLSLILSTQNGQIKPWQSNAIISTGRRGVFAIESVWTRWRLPCSKFILDRWLNFDTLTNSHKAKNAREALQIILNCWRAKAEEIV